MKAKEIYLEVCENTDFRRKYSLLKPGKHRLTVTQTYRFLPVNVLNDLSKFTL